MKFLVSVPKEMDKDGKWATVREPVVPCFPSQHAGAFLAVPSFRLAEKAEVAETDADPDEIAEALAKEYPGLPRGLHENYVLYTLKAIYDFEEGAVFRIRVSQRQAMLVNDRTGDTTILWNEQPLP